MGKLLPAWIGKGWQTPRRSIRFKLVLFFLVVAVIPLLSLSFFSYRTSSDLLNYQFGRYGQNAVTQLQYQLDSHLNQMQLTAEYIHSYLLNPAKPAIRVEIPKTYSQIADKNVLEDFLKALKTTRYQGIFIFTRSGYYYGENSLDGTTLQEEEWWTSLPSDFSGEYWAGLYEPKHYQESYIEPGGKVLGLIVPIRNQSGPLMDSRILIELKADKVYELLTMFEQDTKTHVTIRSGDGTIVYETGEPFEPKANDVLWTKKLETNDWVIEARLPYRQFYQSSTVIRTYTALGIAFSVPLALLLAYLFSSRITRRIRNVKESMHLAGTGKLGTRLTVDSDDELGVLARSFNRMIGQFGILVDEAAEKERLKKEAELRAIHYQINPHLLFNTLNSIQWKAKLQGNEDIRLMLYHLTMVLEGSLDITQELVTVERELAMIGHFLHIQRIRYGEVFTFESSVNDAVKRFLIPRMSLQPLFENIYFHAFEDGAGRISLTIEEDENELLLTLRDDGAGIPDERLKKLLTPEGRQGKRGLGLYNVDQKFKLHFGDVYGLQIQSTHGQGTRITIRWPKREAF